MYITIFIVGLLSLAVVGAAIPPFNTFVVDPNDAFADCNQNEEYGLGPVMQDIYRKLPMENILTLLAIYLSDDEEMQQLFLFIESPEFANLMNVMATTKEFLDVMDYMCTELHFNSFFYLNALGGLLGLPPVNRPQGPTPADFGLQPGLRGFWNETTNIMPTEEISDFWWYNRCNNVYLQRAINKLESDDFRILADKVEYSTEFQYLVYLVNGFGFNMEEITTAMRRWLGWIE